MFVEQFALLFLEAIVMAGLVLGLFRARSVLGLSPLYIVMGGFQYLEATLSLRVALWPGFEVYPGSSVMFTANLFAVLLVYLKEDAIEARKLVYGLVLANAGLTLVSLLVSAHFVLPGIDTFTSMSAREFINNAQIAIVGSGLLFLDVIGIILIYEFVSRYTRFVFVRLLVSLLAVTSSRPWSPAWSARRGRARSTPRRCGRICGSSSPRPSRPRTATSPTCSRC
jgi:vitamin uptake sensor VUPS-like protein